MNIFSGFFFSSDTFVEICIHYKVTNFLRFGKVFYGFFIAVICLVSHRHIHVNIQGYEEIPVLNLVD